MEQGILYDNITKRHGTVTIKTVATISPDSDDPVLVEKIDKTMTVAAAMWLTIVGTLGILFLPLLVSGLIDELSFDKKRAGFIAATEMAGVAIASGLGVIWVRRFNWRTTAVASTVIFIAGNLVSVDINSYWPMLVSRFVVGIASGALLAIGLACQSDSKNAVRIFGYWVACQMTVSSAGYLLLPIVRENWGLDGFLFALVLLGLTAFLAVAQIPAHGLKRAVTSEMRQGLLRSGPLALFGALLFFMAQGGLWAFLERLGLGINLTTTQIGFALALSSWLGIAGGLAKNWLADALGSLSPFTFVIVGQLVMLVLFETGTDILLFGTAVCMLQFFWAMGMAALLGGFNVIDKTGGLVLLLMSIAKVGYSLGPALMGWLIIGEDYSRALVAGGVLVIVGMSISRRLIKNGMTVAVS